MSINIDPDRCKYVYRLSTGFTASLVDNIDLLISPLAHLSIAGEVRLSPCGGEAPSGRCCDPEPMVDGRQ